MVWHQFVVLVVAVLHELELLACQSFSRTLYLDLGPERSRCTQPKRHAKGTRTISTLVRSGQYQAIQQLQFAEWREAYPKIVEYLRIWKTFWLSSSPVFAPCNKMDSNDGSIYS